MYTFRFSIIYYGDLFIFCLFILILAYLDASNSANNSKEFNIICVDWSNLSREFLYVNSVMYAEKVGRRVGEFIVFLKLGGFIQNYKQVHIIGN